MCDRERFLVRLDGGPCPGDLVVVAAEWPLADELHVPPLGVYRKTAESQLPAQSHTSHVMRGALYHWAPASTSHDNGRPS